MNDRMQEVAARQESRPEKTFIVHHVEHVHLMIFSNDI
jgi:hypothetical protein